MGGAVLQLHTYAALWTAAWQPQVWLRSGAESKCEWLCETLVAASMGCSSIRWICKRPSAVTGLVNNHCPSVGCSSWIDCTTYWLPFKAGGSSSRDHDQNCGHVWHAVWQQLRCVTALWPGCPPAAVVDAFARIVKACGSLLLYNQDNADQCCSIRQDAGCIRFCAPLHLSSCFHVWLAGCAGLSSCSGRTMLLQNLGSHLDTARFVCRWQICSPHLCGIATVLRCALVLAAPAAMLNFLLPPCVGEVVAF